ncbi:hypothetical protein [Mycolicibacterium hodleri]|uniref:Uncharacterized protein n=1 Tax=Mycolicibacterium hodleri TaxID=49897 RepID=A0A502ECR1_9MYCO|nr:hypothetical protein [Mycolicibacterium hodleri]TPG34171.1 hypothetical protein EAH80_11205 [Mycolicibacterium hodleri]
MNALHLVSSTGPSIVGPGSRVTAAMPTKARAAGVDRMNDRCFVPYVQDPPIALGALARSSAI